MLQEFITIRRKLQDEDVTSSEIKGHFIADHQDLTLLTALSAAGVLDEFVTRNNQNFLVNELNPGDLVTIRLYPRNLNPQAYFETFDDFIRTCGQTAIPHDYYINSINFNSATTPKPESIINYEFTTQLIAFLTTLSSYQKGNELVFFQAKDPLVIVTNYSDADFGNLSDVPILINHVSTSADSEERKIIFQNDMASSLGKIAEKKLRFPYLLKNFPDIFANYQLSHKLYLEKYSYTKLKSEVDKEILDYSKKLQTVLNDAQGKLVAIPAAYLLIVGQFDLTGTKMFLNLMLVLSAFIFSTLLEVLIRNQFAALAFMFDDIDRFKKTFDKSKASVVGIDFNQQFTKLMQFYYKQRRYLQIIRGIVWFTPVFAIILFFVSLTGVAFTNILLKFILLSVAHFFRIPHCI